MIKGQTKKKKKKKDQTKIDIIIIEIKNKKLDWNDKIKNYNFFNKRIKKKSKVEWLNKKTLYIQIRVEGLN